MQTDYLDVLLLHSCNAEQLAQEELIDALLACKKEGLVRYVGYSGDGVDAQAALAMDVFDCLETSVNICDQQVLDKVLPAAREKQLGVVAKRSLANACWRQQESFYVEYTKVYVERLQQMAFSPESLGFDGSWEELALRFTVFQPGLHAAIIGGKNLEHIKANVKILGKGPLAGEIIEKLRALWAEHDDGSWVGQI